ncbi:MAG: hypothetical protein KO275_07655, partial [Methanobacterium sp.]|nr:hypothetical protein [Methanobacterium sp.]
MLLLPIGHGSVKIKRNTTVTLLLIFSITIILSTSIVCAEEETTIINDTNTSQNLEPDPNT